MLTPDYVKALGTVFDAALGYALPQWSVEKALRLMDENLIQASVTSISAPGASFGDAKFGRALARQCNESAAKLISDHPLRFGAFATVPLPDVEGTLAEIAYALDTLKFDGVELLTNYKGKYLGDTAFEEVHKELNRRKAVVHVHPGTVPLNPFAPVSDFLMEAPFDTTRTITSLICNGVLERYPDISFIFSHGGGTMPFLATRIGVGSGFMWPGMQEKAPKGFFYYLSHMYFDIALSASPYALPSLRVAADTSHILYGSDYPFAPDSGIKMNTEGFATGGLFTAEEKKAVDANNALALFPRLKLRIEAGS